MSRPWLLISGLIIPVLLAFAEVRNCHFVRWDDYVNVGGNPFLWNVNPGTFARFWSAPFQDLYIPVTYSCWAVAASFAKLPVPAAMQGAQPSPLSPLPFHLLNLLVHLFNVWLVFRLLRSLTQSTGGAFVGALIFGLHPVQVEAVAWITGLKDVLGACFSLIALNLVLAYGGIDFWPREEIDRSRPRIGLLIAATISFILSLLTKPGGVVLPAIVVLILLIIRPDRRKAVGITAGVWAALSVVCVLVTKSVQTLSAGTGQFSWGQRLAVAGDALAFYAGKVLWPVSLGIDYGRTPQAVLAQSTSLLWMPLLPALLAAIFLIWRKVPKLGLALGVFVLGVLPVLGLVPFAFQQYSTVADRYLYFPLTGICLLAALGWSAAVRRAPNLRMPLRAVAGVVCLFLGLSTSVQCVVWYNDFSLFQNALAVNPRSWASQHDLGLALQTAGQLDAAMELFEKSLANNPSNRFAENSMGNALATKGQYGEAVSHYNKAIALAPEFAEAYYQRGWALERNGQTGKAVIDYREALRLRPDLVFAQQALARVTGESPGAGTQALGAVGG